MGALKPGGVLALDYWAVRVNANRIMPVHALRTRYYAALCILVCIAVVS